MSEDELLRRARRGMAPRPADRARMRARLLASVGAAGAATATTTAASASTTGVGASAIGGVAAAKVIAVLLGASVVVGVGYRAFSPAVDARTEVTRPNEHPATRAPSDELVLDLPAVVEPPVAAAEGDEGVGASSAALDESAPVRAPATTPRPARVPSDLAHAPTSPDRLADETALIARARDALRAHDPRAALAALDEHARAHPRGILTEEREVGRVLAYCALGDVERAQTIGARFLQAYPSSLHADAMRSPCDP